MHDVYFLPAYGKLNEHIEDGEAQTFEFTCEYGYVRSVFIRRTVPFLLNGEQYYDAITPYGYGGPVVIRATDREKLVEAYTNAYRTYCRENRIVDEFVRFHPLAENALDFGALYQTVFNRHTIAVDLTDEEYSKTQFTPDCRNMIRKAAKKGVEVEVDEECSRISEFIPLYFATMDKNHASEYYYFEADYFDQIQHIEGCKLILINALLEGKLIGSAMFMLSGENMHYHLSSTDPEYYSYAANNAIIKQAIEYGRAHGMKWLHLGGGVSTNEKDPLFKFKHNFGRTEKNLKDFYMGTAVFLPDEYAQLCEIAQEQGIEQGSFFPAYRKAH